MVKSSLANAPSSSAQLPAPTFQPAPAAVAAAAPAAAADVGQGVEQGGLLSAAQMHLLKAELSHAIEFDCNGVDAVIAKLAVSMKAAKNSKLASDAIARLRPGLVPPRQLAEKAKVLVSAVMSV